MSTLSPQRICMAYGIGSFGAALTVVALWGLSHILKSDWQVMSSSLTFKDFLAPVMFGGLCGFLYLLPIHWSWKVKGLFFSIVPATLVLFYETQGVTKLWKSFDFAYLFRAESLTTFAVFALIWGLLTAHMNEAP